MVYTMNTAITPKNAYISILTIIIVLIVAYAYVWLFKTSWNKTLPQLFQIQSITLVQAFFLLILAGMIFKTNVICSSACNKMNIGTK